MAVHGLAKALSSSAGSWLLVRSGNESAIAYVTQLATEGFENFSIGPELRHFCLPGHMDAVIPGGSGMHESRAGFNSKDRYEAEADRFAAGFLMPRFLFFPATETAGVGLAAIEGLATLCKTSLHATAIRYAQCTREPVAVIISGGSRIG